MIALDRLEAGCDFNLSYDEPLDFDGLIDTMKPEPGDYITTDYRNFHINGCTVLTIDEGEDFGAALRHHMDAAAHWPNVWFLPWQRKPVLIDLWD